MLHREIQDAMRELAERFNLHNFKKVVLELQCLVLGFCGIIIC